VNARSAPPSEQEVHQAQIVLCAPSLIFFSGEVDGDPQLSTVKCAEVAVHAKLNTVAVGLANVSWNEFWAIVEREVALPAAKVG